jgi:hypothetical protein
MYMYLMPLNIILSKSKFLYYSVNTAVLNSTRLVTGVDTKTAIFLESGVSCSKYHASAWYQDSALKKFNNLVVNAES